MTTTLFILLAAVVAALLALMFRTHAGRTRRQRAVGELLDAADALEARLRTARAEIEAVAGDDDNPIQVALREMLRQMASGNPDDAYQSEPMRAEYLERDARLAVMDQQGVQTCVLYPANMALSAEHYMIDTDALYVNIRSFNRWYNEHWGFDYERRILATALLSLRDVDRAVAEVEQMARGQIAAGDVVDVGTVDGRIGHVAVDDNHRNVAGAQLGGERCVVAGRHQ